jgi:exodeoxyribonuclease VII large subunit
VARPINNPADPTVTPGAHQIHYPISDSVPDLRAPTPSAAAELIVPDIADLRRHMDNCARALGRELFNRVRDAQQRLDHTRETLRRCLSHKIDSYKRGLLHIAAALQPRKLSGELMLRRNRLLDLNRRLLTSPSRTIENAKQRFQRIEGILRVLGPDATLRRGYSITRDTKDNLIRTIGSVRPRMKIRTRVSDGEFESEIL